MLGLITPLAGVIILIRVRAGPRGPLMKGLAGKLLLLRGQGVAGPPLTYMHTPCVWPEPCPQMLTLPCTTPKASSSGAETRTEPMW